MTSGCSSVPSRKQRRRRRRRSSGRDSPALSALGDFQILPLEIFQMVLNYLSVRDISRLSMVSKTISALLSRYICTSSGSRRLLLQDFHSPQLPARREGTSILEHYRSLGLLLKRCTLLLPTRDRLRYVHKVLSGVSCFKLNGCASPLHCLGLQCYGVFLQMLTAGWDELECHRVFNFLWDLGNLARKVQTVVSSKPGSARRLELRIRLFCRAVLLSGSRRGDSAFWLTRILKPWPMVNQARLLYLIFGPVSSRDGHVVWQKMIEGPTDETSLKGLADAIKLLYGTEAREWTADDVISLVDELSVVPQQWLMENNARLLLLSGNSICFTFMASKAVNGRAVELARLMVFMVLVCEKDLYCMDWAVKMMQKVCKVFSSPWERKNFLQCLESCFARMLMDLLQAVLAGERDEQDSSFLNLFHLMNAQANFHKEILCLAMGSSSSSTP
ncbi:F-box only protein 47 isoform X1 [Oenanthe melanoleuca]|uniref:F-box only protein 47 isoform X1 n=1 Tax=Oenanthe melanoleuca TaxID=2939378 RepID=UPI0024C1826F|nr:F-box only protein 47 isoform X1 [Oenanthe melanoleuca]XP_056368222.1 F-box only protein 47 isoform X1 [Oenanthe melanoleuca]